MLRFFINLAGPVFAKEMVEIARRKRYYFNRALYGVALLIAVTIVWVESAGRLHAGGGGQIQAMGQVALEIFIAVSLVQYGAIFLLVPLFVAGLVAGEREANSLELLFTTSLTDREIVLGKLASRLANMALLVLCGLPVVNLVLLFGGVDPAAVRRTVAASLLGMLYAGSMTMYFSVISKSPTAALIRSFWSMAVWIVGLPIFGVIFVETFGIRPADPAAIVVWGQLLLNPGFLFLTAMIPELHREASNYLGEWFFPLCFFPICLWCAAVLWRSVVRLRLPPTLLLRFASSWHPLAAAMRVGRTIQTRIEGRRRLSAERLWFGRTITNPLWIRARRTAVYDREGHINRVQWLAGAVAALFLVGISIADARSDGEAFSNLCFWSFVGLLIVLFVARRLWRADSRESLAWVVLLVVGIALAERLLVGKSHTWDDEEAAMIFLVPTWIAAWLLTAILGATSLVGDRRRGFFELVLTSPLEPAEIVRGTMLAVVEHLLPLYGLAAALTGWFVMAGDVSLVGAVDIMITGTLFGLLLLELGVICSLAAERPPGAIIPTFVFGVMVCAGIFLIAIMIEDAIGPLLLVVGVGGSIFSWFWAKRSGSPASIATLFLTGHLGLVSIACLLNLNTTTYLSRLEAVLVVGMNPLAMIYCHIEPRELRQLGFGWFYVPSYWLAMAVNFALAWWWAMANFDRLSGRAWFDVRQQLTVRRTMAARQPVPLLPTVAPLPVVAERAGELPRAESS